MQLFDLHADIGYDVIQKRKAGKTDILQTYHIDKFKQGEIKYICMASYFEGNETWEDMQYMVSALVEEIALCEDIDLVLSKKDLLENGHIKAILSIEGMCGIKVHPQEKIQWLYDAGVRIASLCWNDENALATGIKGNDRRGLSILGESALQKMITLDMLIDVSHANEQTFWDIARIKEAKIIATHSNARVLCNHPRNLWDEQLKEIKNHKGMIGIVSAPDFVDQSKDKQDIAHLVDHICYLKEAVGIASIALGFDFMDFYAGYEDIHTKGLKDCSYAQRLIEELHTRGFHENEISMISHGNALRILKTIL